MISCLNAVLMLFLLIPIYTQDFIVSLKNGKLQGTTVSSIKGKEIFSFYKIPYAKPPVGKRRFEAPEDPKPWKGLLNATVPGPACLQHITQSFLTTGQEDCLYLNVFTPVLPNISAVPPWFPVIVFFHNGVYITGDNLFGPQYLLEEDVILVTANYRLGVLGFLSTEDAEVPGNNGLKDQVAVLKWVRNNIEAFGGDKARITIAGNTAGAVSVHLHYFSPLSVGLFQNGIAQSGSAFVPWAIAHNLREKTEFIAETLSCPTNNSRLMIDCLRTYPPQQLVLFTQSYEVFINTPFAPFGPCIEREGKNPFLTDYPYKLLQSGSGLDLPIMFSDCENEGLYPLAEIIDNEYELDFLRRRWESVAQYLLNFNETVIESNKALVSRIIWNFYINGRYMPRTDLSIIKLFGDRQFLADNGRAAALHARSNLFNSVYFYLFTYRGQRSNSEFYNPSSSGNYGAANGDDLLYILQDSRQFFAPPSTPQDLAMINVMVKIWASFATSGLPDIGEKIWIPVSPTDFRDGTLRILKIAGPNKLSNSTKCDFGNISFWDSLPLNEPGSGRHS